MQGKKFAVSDYTTAEEIKAVRKHLKLTQKEFAELICCGKSTVERWEVSKEKITGPLVLLLKMLERYPDYPSRLQIPQREYPLRLWYMYRQKPCTMIDVNDESRFIARKRGGRSGKPCGGTPRMGFRRYGGRCRQGVER